MSLLLQAKCFVLSTLPVICVCCVTPLRLPSDQLLFSPVCSCLPLGALSPTLPLAAILLVAGVLLLVSDLLLFLPLQSLAVHLLVPGRLLFVVLLLAAEVRRCSSPEGPQGYPIRPLGAREPRGYPLRLNRSSLGARGYPLSPPGALLQLGSKRSPRRAAGLSHQALGGHLGTAGLSRCFFIND